MANKKEYGVRYLSEHESGNRWCSTYDYEHMRAARYTLDEAKEEANSLLEMGIKKTRIYKGNTMVEEITASAPAAWTAITEDGDGKIHIFKKTIDELDRYAFGAYRHEVEKYGFTIIAMYRERDIAEITNL